MTPTRERIEKLAVALVFAAMQRKVVIPEHDALMSAVDELFSELNDYRVCTDAGAEHRKVRKLEAEIAGLRENDARLDWLEENHTLHKDVDICYVVDGYTVELLDHDGMTVLAKGKGENLRAAIDAAMQEQTSGR